MFTGVTLNSGKTLQFGDLCQWKNPSLNGFNPVSQRVPDTLNIMSYKTELLTKDTGVAGIISNAIGTGWTYEDFGEYLASIKDYMTENCIWLWGDIEEGGAFLYWYGNSNYCGFCTWQYFYSVTTNPETGEKTNIYQIWCGPGQISAIPFQTESPTVPGIYADTQIAFFNEWRRTQDVGDLLPPEPNANGFYFLMTGFPGMYDDNTDTRIKNPVPDPLVDYIWQQEEHLRYFSWDNYKNNYLKNYTQQIEALGSSNLDSDHPWERYIQNRTLINTIIYLEVPVSDTVIKTGGYFSNQGIDESGNPYGGGTSTEGGGTGDGSEQSDNVDEEGLPGSEILNTGLCAVYLPTSNNMSDFVNYIFTSITDPLSTHIKKMFSDPIQSIMSVNLCHLQIPYTTSQEISFAGIGSNVTSPVASTLYYKIEYSLSLNEYWGSALDYSNYTKIKIYLPYCGIYDLSVDDFMSPNGKIDIVYKVDILSGMCVAMVKCNRRDNHGNYLNSVLYQFNGNIFLSVPLTSTNWSSYFQSVLNMASVAVAPSASSVLGMAQDVMSQKVSVQKSGNIGSNFGYMGVQTPYLIIERPSQSIPVNFGSFNGYPSNIYGKVSTFKGYTEVDTDALWTNNFTHATSEECDMIKEIMNGGIYL